MTFTGMRTAIAPIENRLTGKCAGTDYDIYYKNIAISFDRRQRDIEYLNQDYIVTHHE